MLIICSNKTKSAPIKQDIGVKRLIVGDKQRCLTCNVFIVKVGKGAKLSNLQPRNKPYNHAANCAQKGKF